MSTQDPVSSPDVRVDYSPHPSEHSRLLLALSATAIVFGGGALLVVGSGGWIALGGLVLIVAVLAGLAWVGLQLFRARMLGRSIRVTSESMPELQAVMDDVRGQLDYHRRVDVYVVQKADPPAQLTSYLGTKVIVLEGDLIADLLAEQRAQLTYLLARFIGALKARHQRLTIVFVILEAVESLKVLFPFLTPYYRATTYSGDQIGHVCCGDLDAALAATERLLVGKELEPTLRARGVVQQARLVRRRVLPRLVQLALSEPHLTNRYLNLLFWARRAEPHAWHAFCEEADAETKRELTMLWTRSPHRRPAASRARRLTASTAAAALTALVLTGVAIATLSLGHDRTAYASENVPTEPTTLEPAPTSSSPTPAPAPDDPTASSATDLVGHVPIGFRDSCKEIAAGAAAAAIDCTPTDDGAPGTVRYFQFSDQATMDGRFDAYDADLTGVDCPDQQVSWDANGSGGRVACYTDSIGSNYVVWTDEQLDILGYAKTILIDADGLYRWWGKDSGPV
jgi:hypothetical protein